MLGSRTTLWVSLLLITLPNCSPISSKIFYANFHMWEAWGKFLILYNLSNGLYSSRILCFKIAGCLWFKYKALTKVPITYSAVCCYKLHLFTEKAWCPLGLIQFLLLVALLSHFLLLSFSLVFTFFFSSSGMLLVLNYVFWLFQIMTKWKHSFWIKSPFRLIFSTIIQLPVKINVRSCKVLCNSSSFAEGYLYHFVVICWTVKP